MSVRIIIYFLVLIIVILLGIVNFKKLTIPFKLLTVIVTVTILIEITAKFCAVKFKNNMPVSHIASLFEYIFFSLTFYYLFKSSLIKKTIIVLMIIMCFFFIINALFLQPYLTSFPTNMIMVSEILYSVFSLLLFKQMLLYPIQTNITKQSVFWFNLSVLFFSTTMFLDLGLINYFLSHHLNDNLLYDCNFYINILFYSLIGFSIHLNSKENLQTQNG